MVVDRTALVRMAWIGWTTLCGAVCVLLVVFWVRSYIWLEEIELPVAANRAVGGSTLPGVLAVGWRDVPEAFRVERRSVEDWRRLHPRGPSPLRGDVMWTQSTKAVYVPFWLPTLLSAACAIVPWRRQFSRRFSLGALLITITLVAIVLGLIVNACGN